MFSRLNPETIKPRTTRFDHQSARFRWWFVGLALVSLLALSTTSAQISSPDGLWAQKPLPSPASPARRPAAAAAWVQPKSFRAVTLDAAALDAVLQRA